jgi:hypothetical protein
MLDPAEELPESDLGSVTSGTPYCGVEVNQRTHLDQQGTSAHRLLTNVASVGSVWQDGKAGDDCQADDDEYEENVSASAGT